jgi:hypothetical protein
MSDGVLRIVIRLVELPAILCVELSVPPESVAPFRSRGTEGSDMTPLDGFLMIAGFTWGCLPIFEWLIDRRSPGFKQSRQKLAPSPWI